MKQKVIASLSGEKKKYCHLFIHQQNTILKTDLFHQNLPQNTQCVTVVYFDVDIPTTMRWTAYMLEHCFTSHFLFSHWSLFFLADVFKSFFFTFFSSFFEAGISSTNGIWFSCLKICFDFYHGYPLYLLKWYVRCVQTIETLQLLERNKLSMIYHTDQQLLSVTAHFFSFLLFTVAHDCHVYITSNLAYKNIFTYTSRFHHWQCVCRQKLSPRCGSVAKNLLLSRVVLRSVLLHHTLAESLLLQTQVD